MFSRESTDQRRFIRNGEKSARAEKGVRSKIQDLQKRVIGISRRVLDHQRHLKSFSEFAHEDALGRIQIGKQKF